MSTLTVYFYHKRDFYYEKLRWPRIIWIIKSQFIMEDSRSIGSEVIDLAINYYEMSGGKMSTVKRRGYLSKVILIYWSLH